MKNLNQDVEEYEKLFHDRQHHARLLTLLSDKKLERGGDARLYYMKGSIILTGRGKRINPYQITRNAKNSIIYFSKALEIDPNFAWAYHGRSRAYSRYMGRDMSKALADINIAI